MLINILSLYIITPYTINAVGDQYYGLWTLIASFTGYYFLLDFGISSTVIKFVAKSIADKNLIERDILVSNAFFLFTFISLIALLPILIISFGFYHFSPEELKTISVILILIAGFEFMVCLPLKVFQGVAYAYLDYPVSSLLDILKTIIRAVGIFLLIYHREDIIFLPVISLTTSIFYYVCISYFVFSRHKLKISWNQVSKKELLALTGFSKYLFITQIGDLLRFRIDYIVISMMLSLESITIYAIAQKLADVYMQVIMKMLGVLNPLIFQLSSETDSIKRVDTYFNCIRISCILSFAIGTSIIVSASLLISLWMGDNYLQAVTILSFLVFALSMDLIQIPSHAILQSIEKHHYFSWLTIIEGVCNLILSIILGLNYGLIGIVLGTVIPMTTIKILVLPYFLCRESGMSLKYYYQVILGPLSLAVVISTFVFYILLPEINFHSQFLNLIFTFTIQFCLYILFSMMLFLSKTEQKTLINKFIK
ncbi:MAG: oligosaccharide flippase family protein [Psychromonas sp.]